MSDQMNQVLSRLRQARREIEDAHRTLKKDGRALLKGAFAKIFEEHPKVAAFKWHQYTPGFNDGDPCRFTAGTVEISMDSEEFLSDWEIRQKLGGEDKEEAQSALEKVDDVRGALGDEGLEALFGDPAEVTITRDGIQVEETDAPY